MWEPLAYFSKQVSDGTQLAQIATNRVYTYKLGHQARGRALWCQHEDRPREKFFEPQVGYRIFDIKMQLGLRARQFYTLILKIFFRFSRFGFQNIFSNAKFLAEMASQIPLSEEMHECTFQNINISPLNWRLSQIFNFPGYQFTGWTHFACANSNVRFWQYCL